ncbi:FAD-binding oxidoreductase [Flavobacteriaceae bacterium LMO-SS05]
MQDVKIISIEYATHDVVHIKTEKPQGITFLAGQAVDVALKKSNWETEFRAFTFTSLQTDEHLEFFIKIYPEHHSVTEQIGKLKPGDTLSIGDVFGDIQYKGEGIFIAGGAGITPFISIFKKLEKEQKLGNNKLIFANKTESDIIEHLYFNKLLGKHFINVLSKEEKVGFEHGYITKDIIKNQAPNKNTYFYLCGPDPMMEAVLKQFQELGIDESQIIKEQF